MLCTAVWKSPSKPVSPTPLAWIRKTAFVKDCSYTSTSYFIQIKLHRNNVVVVGSHITCVRAIKSIHFPLQEKIFLSTASFEEGAIEVVSIVQDLDAAC